MLSSIRLSAAIVGLLFLAACGGGGGGATVPPSTTKAGGSGSAALSFFIPAANAPAGKRRSNALPSATQSIVLTITSGTGTPLNPAIAPLVLNVTGSPQMTCSPVAGGQMCTANVTVPFASLTFTVAAYGGQNATGALLAEGSTTAAISPTTSNVSITTTSQQFYAGVSSGGGMGFITIDHSANPITFTVTTGSNNYVTSGIASPMPNGDLKLSVTTSTDPGMMAPTVAYGREVLNSMLIFVSTGTNSPPVDGSASSGADLGAAVAMQGCPTAGSSLTVSAAVVGGPGWSATPSTSPAYTNGTAVTTVSNGTATLAYSGYDYSTAGTQGSVQTGTQVCNGGIYSLNGQGTVAISPDNVLVVSSGNGNVQPTDTKVGDFGFAGLPATPVNLTPVVVGNTYDGFAGGFTTVGGATTKFEYPFQLQPVSSTQMNVCPYSNFEAGVVNTGSCGTVLFGTPASQAGVVPITVTIPSLGLSAVPGDAVVGQTSNSKYVIFGNVGGVTIEFLQH